jgi:hypothetical protein
MPRRRDEERLAFATGRVRVGIGSGVGSTLALRSDVSPLARRVRHEFELESLAVKPDAARSTLASTGRRLAAAAQRMAARRSGLSGSVRRNSANRNQQLSTTTGQ